MARIVFLDESGTGKLSEDQWIIEVGVITDPDRDWRRIDAGLREIAMRYLPEMDFAQVRFHATEILSGIGPWKGLSFVDRKEALGDVCCLPSILELPLVSGTADRRLCETLFAAHDEPTRFIMSHATAYMSCVAGVERYMRESTQQQEVALMVHENHEQSRELIDTMHRSLATREFEKYPNATGWRLSTYLPTTRIAEAPYFVSKREASICQLADACAHAIRRGLGGKPLLARVREAISMQLPRDDRASDGAASFSIR